MNKFILLFLIMFPQLIFGIENNVCLEIKGKIKSEKKSLSNVTIELVKNGVVVTNVLSSKSGKFKVYFEKGFVYKMHIKKQGYFSQVVEVNTNTPSMEDFIWDFKFKIDLVPVIEEYRWNIMSKPFVSIRYNLMRDEFEKQVNDKMLRIYNQLMEDYKMSRVEKHSEIIHFADVAFNEGNISMAENLYLKAEQLQPFNAHADYQLLIIDRLHKINEKNHEKYDELIEKADAYYENEELEKAKKTYTKALSFKDEEYPKERILSIKQTISTEGVINKKN